MNLRVAGQLKRPGDFVRMGFANRTAVHVRILRGHIDHSPIDRPVAHDDTVTGGLLALRPEGQTVCRDQGFQFNKTILIQELPDTTPTNVRSLGPCPWIARLRYTRSFSLEIPFISPH
jgi:hypothetical protein